MISASTYDPAGACSIARDHTRSACTATCCRLPPPPALLQAASIHAAQLPPDLRLRPGVPADRPAFIRGILREKLNPLALDPARFTVAERGRGENAHVLGFGQIKPLGQQALELSTLIVDESER